MEIVIATNTHTHNQYIYIKCASPLQVRLIFIKRSAGTTPLKPQCKRRSRKNGAEKQTSRQAVKQRSRVMEKQGSGEEEKWRSREGEKGRRGKGEKGRSRKAK